MKNNTINCIKRYIEITENGEFTVHWKKLANRLSKGISEGYEKGSHEPEVVKIVETIINKVGKFDTSNNKFKIVTNSVFIHGNKSQVEFDYYPGKTQRELGDIIFILSVIYNGKKYFEKMTINQVKKSGKASWAFYNDSSKEQLYLLSRFPAFEGINGSLVPKKKYNIPNYSRCLGTHGLLYYPGDFAFISSKILSILLSNKKTLRLEDILSYTQTLYSNKYFYPLGFKILDPEEWMEYLHYIDEFVLYHRYYWTDLVVPNFLYNLPILGNSCIAYDSYEFAHEYLRGNIGELIYSNEPQILHNRFAFQFLQDLLTTIYTKAKKKNYKEISHFIDLYRDPYKDYNNQGGKKYGEPNKEPNNYEGGGIGIIHTTIDLGEGE